MLSTSYARLKSNVVDVGVRRISTVALGSGTVMLVKLFRFTEGGSSEPVAKCLGRAGDEDLCLTESCKGTDESLMTGLLLLAEGDLVLLNSLVSSLIEGDLVLLSSVVSFCIEDDLAVESDICRHTSVIRSCRCTSAGSCLGTSAAERCRCISELDCCRCTSIAPAAVNCMAASPPGERDLSAAPGELMRIDPVEMARGRRTCSKPVPGTSWNPKDLALSRAPGGDQTQVGLCATRGVRGVRDGDNVSLRLLVLGGAAGAADAEEDDRHCLPIGRDAAIGEPGGAYTETGVLGSESGVPGICDCCGVAGRTVLNSFSLAACTESASFSVTVL